MPRSMTGFARSESQHNWGTVACEIRSVNHRYLETNFRVPDTLRSLENDLRTKLKAKLSRGKIEVSIFVKLENVEADALTLNENLAKQLGQLAQQVSKSITNAAPINPIDILKWPGVLQSAEVAKEELHLALMTLFEDSLNKLIANREREGAELKNFISRRLQDIGTHVAEVRKRLPEIVEAHQSKLREKLSTLQVEVDEERLTQELVYFAQRADVTEELDRLEAHINEVNLALGQQKPIGRRLDFLMQELNREANTLSSKSVASDTTQNAVDLKVLIEQMREQIQNLE